MSLTRLEVEGFRCFGPRQEAPLAPLTLLVGENSAGKTSFLAMVKALMESVATGPVPDFNAPPYEFGSYDDMAHRRGARGGGPNASFGGSLTMQPDPRTAPVEFSATFAKSGKAPELIHRRYESGGYWFEEASRPAPGTAEIGSPTTHIKISWPRQQPSLPAFLPPFVAMTVLASSLQQPDGASDTEVVEGSVAEFQAQWETIQRRLYRAFGNLDLITASGTLAGAPVRSRPQRIYEASPGSRIAEGDSMPRRLADLSAANDAEWKSLQKKLVLFGQISGLFDEVGVRRLGTNDSDPFQIRVRRYGGARKGPWRNLKDVGYGVSQALPILMEVMNGDPSRVFLLQQPEVHLHPQAQAALGSLFVNAAAEGRQLFVETHSDHLLDRVRMDIRDKKADLGADGVSVLYFERKGLGARIHPLRFDENGNVLGAPTSYRRFFLEEVERQLGL